MTYFCDFLVFVINTAIFLVGFAYILLNRFENLNSNIIKQIKKIENQKFVKSMFETVRKYLSIFQLYEIWIYSV